MSFKHELISSSFINRIKPLVDYICSYEIESSKYNYDPIDNPVLNKPILFKSMFNSFAITDEILLKLFKGLSSDIDYTLSSFFRVYIEGMLSPQYENKVLMSTPKLEEGFNDYILRIMEGHKFGIIINGAEQWSDELAHMAAKIFGPIIEAQGTYNSTVEVTLFIGNYGYTPFGIHIDDPYTSVVHFHVGPSKKEMTLFGKEEFHELNGEEKNCFEPDTLIDKGAKYLIEAGDVFLLPPHYYHVGNTQDFSISIAFALSKYPNEIMTKNILQKSIGEVFNEVHINDLINDSTNKKTSLSKWVLESKERYLKRKESRSNLKYSSLISNCYVIEGHTNLFLNPFFKITYVVNKGKILVFSRGNHFSIPYDKSVKNIIDKIPNIEFTPLQLFGETEGEVSLNNIIKILQQLVNFGGLFVIYE